MKADPIVITGAGIVCAVGNNKSEVLKALRSAQCGLRSVRYLDTAHSEFPVGEVQLSNGEMAEQLGVPDTVNRTSLMGIMAAREALAQASAPAGRTAFVSGTTVGGMDKSEQYYLDFLDNDSRNEYIPQHDCGACTETIADNTGRFSYVSSISTACSSAANAILLGAELIESGQYDMVVAGGAECITRFHLNGFNSLMILDTQPCRPFDATRAGLNLGEGAAYVVLEREGAALARGAHPLAILSGWGNACDAFHQTATSPEGEGAYRAMAAAIGKAGLQPLDIDYVNAHGTATSNNDVTESSAMKRLFGEHLPFISSTKGATGHTTSASGSIEAVICLLAMQAGFAPATVGCAAPDPSCVPVLQDVAEGIPLTHLMCNSFGFGGNDTSLIISKPC